MSAGGYQQVGYLRGYPVFTRDDFLGGDGYDVLKLDIEHPLEGWVTSPQIAERLKRDGVIRSSPEESLTVSQKTDRSH